jgi:putative acetyltransferase
MFTQPIANMQTFSIREIEQRDNVALANIVRTTLAEFGANHPGTVYYDPTTDHLFELFREPKSRYFVAEADGSIAGGGGIFPTMGLPEGTCELVKMYLVPKARGKGIGQAIILKCLETARKEGFGQVYIETMPELEMAINLYEKFGWQHLDHPIGNTGHFGCSKWMILKL